MHRKGIRFLAVISFLLLVAPFYDQCAGGMQEETQAEQPPLAVITQNGAAGSNPVDSNPRALEPDSIAAAGTWGSISKYKPFERKMYDLIDDPSNDNAFELAADGWKWWGYLLNEPHTYWAEARSCADNCRYTYISRLILLGAFTPIIVLTFVGLVLSFTRYIRLVHQTAITTAILLFFAMICILLDCQFEEFGQIKWGYWTFSLVQLILIAASKTKRGSR